MSIVVPQRPDCVVTSPGNPAGDEWHNKRATSIVYRRRVTTLLEFDEYEGAVFVARYQ